MKRNLTILSLSLFFFVDPLIFFRVIVGNDGVSLGLAGLLLVSVLVICVKIWKTTALSKSLKRVVLLFTVYVLISSFVRIVIGQQFTYLIQHELVLVQALFVFVLLLSKKYEHYLFQALFLAVLLHSVTLLPFFGFLTERLSQTTAYATGEYSTGIFTRRGTGFFNSSGQLSIFAIGALGIGLFSIKNEKSWRGIAIVAGSVFLGVGSLSRSYIVASLVIFFIFFVTSSLKNKFKLLSLFGVAVLFFVFSSTLSSYVQFINDRFSLLSFAEQNDRIKGETGVEEGWKAVVNYPFFGKPILNEKALWVWNGTMPVRPHFAIIYILGLYGIVFGLPLLLIILLGLKVMMTELINALKRSPSNNVFFLGFLGINLVCLVEPLIETPVYFLFLFGIIIYSRKAFGSTSEKKMPDHNPTITRLSQPPRFVILNS